jgi:hypothetical protein
MMPSPQTSSSVPSGDQENVDVVARKKDKRDKKSKKEAAGLLDGGPRGDGSISPRIPVGLRHPEARVAGNLPSGEAAHMGPHVLVTVKGMSPLQPDTRIVHPFVRLFIVDGRTAAAYAPTSEASLASITYPFDLRSRQTIAPYWADDVPVPVTTAVLHPQADPILLLEVLDFGASTIHGQSVRPDQRGAGFHRVAWGFLRIKSLLGDDLQLRQSAAANIQLFYYQEAFGPFTLSLLQLLPSWFAHPAAYAPQPYFPQPHPSMTTTPDVFFVYANPNNRKVAYPGGIGVDVSYVAANSSLPPPVHSAVQATSFELQLLQALLSNGADAGRTIEVVSRSLALRQREQHENPHVTQDYRRLLGERVVPPTTIIHETRVHGAITAMVFAGSGKLLALAVSSTLQTLIDVRDVLSNRFTTIGLLRGHADRIHQLAFSADETLLLSCSSDKTVKIWTMASLPCIVTSSIEEAHVCISTLPHSFPVYSGIFLQDKHVVTAGYDTRLHVWRVDSAQRSSKLTAAIPNQSTSFFLSAASCEDTRVWTLDSAGVATAWRAVPDDSGEITQVSVRRRVDCKGADYIVLAHPYGFLPCLREGACYILELSSFTVLHRVHGIGRDLAMGFSVLPDGKVFVVGTKTGRMMAWEATTGDMCSSREGAARGQVGFPIARIAWATAQQLCAVASSSGSHAEASTVAAEQLEPADSCMLAILGEVRREEKVLLESDPRSADLVRSLFGGELAAHRTVTPARGIKSQGNDRLKPAYNTNLPPAIGMRGALGDADDARPARRTDKLSRMEQIVGFWKQLVGGQQKKPGAGSGTAASSQV